ncbi:MAG TPA: D-cysteine desulfhydrase family protein [Bacillota bacterium]|nr:D-cysteine desulfhydrase family protein [Bacillota bacterium]
MKLAGMPRILLSEYPTPLEELKRFSAALGGPRILMKRDDLIGFGMGGNKVRKLEYIMADAMASGADVVITTGGVQTNHGRLTAAAARKLGLHPVLVLSGHKPDSYRGNLLLDYIYGAEVHFVSPDDRLGQEERALKLKEDVQKEIARIKEGYEAEGRKCYVIPLGGMMRVATAGYLNGMLETYAQLAEMGEKVRHMVVTTGSTSTTSSLILANKAFNTGIKVIGISVWQPAGTCREAILEELKKDIAYYGYDVCIGGDDFEIFDDYIGAGYSKPSKEGLEAMKLIARTEAIIVDHAYTGKALAGLIDLVKKGHFGDDEAVLFLHTGGAPAIFALERDAFEGIFW